MKRIQIPFTSETTRKLRVGELVYLNGEIYTMRDQAHKRLVDLASKGKKLPFDPRGKTIYYCGPTPTPSGKVIGSCGPTTAERMDPFTIEMLRLGAAAFIGKGERSSAVISAMEKQGCLYFAALGGAGSYYANTVTENTLICFKELGAEAVYRLKVNDFPALVAIDTQGGYLYRKK